MVGVLRGLTRCFVVGVLRDLIGMLVGCGGGCGTVGGDGTVCVQFWFMPWARGHRSYPRQARPFDMADEAVLQELLRQNVPPKAVTHGIYIRFEADEEGKGEKCSMTVVENYSDFLGACLSRFPGPPPPRSLLKAAWRRVAPCFVTDSLVEWFASEESEKHSILWSYVWRYYVNNKDRASRSVKVMRHRRCARTFVVGLAPVVVGLVPVVVGRAPVVVGLAPVRRGCARRGQGAATRDRGRVWRLVAG